MEDVVVMLLAHHSPLLLPLENNQKKLLKERRSHVKDSSPKQTYDKKKEETNVQKGEEGWGEGGTTSAKGECGGRNMNELAQNLCHHVRDDYEPAPIDL